MGYGRFTWKLRQDDRVVVLERTNARALTEEQIPEPVDIVVCDASFIGLEKVLPVPLTFVRPGGRLAALIKPQFEVGRARSCKGGIVRDPALRRRRCNRIEARRVRRLGRARHRPEQ